MSSGIPATNTFPDRRTHARSRYVTRLASLEVGQDFKAPLKHRPRLSVLATRWGRKWGRTFKTSTHSRTLCIVGRVA